MDTNNLLESISRKLAVLVALNLISLNSKATVTDNIKMLSRFGLTAQEIAEILNTSINAVRVIKSRSKGGKK